jgi:hypothetical protein
MSLISLRRLLLAYSPRRSWAVANYLRSADSWHVECCNNSLILMCAVNARAVRIARTTRRKSSYPRAATVSSDDRARGLLECRMTFPKILLFGPRRASDPCRCGAASAVPTVASSTECAPRLRSPTLTGDWRRRVANPSVFGRDGIDRETVIEN